MSHQQEIVEAALFYQRSENLAVRPIGDDTIVMRVRSTGTGTDSVFVLNQTGSLIWRLLAEPSRRDTLVGAVEAEFEVGRAHAEADVASFLELLSRAELIVEVRPETP